MIIVVMAVGDFNLCINIVCGTYNMLWGWECSWKLPSLGSPEDVFKRQALYFFLKKIGWDPCFAEFLKATDVSAIPQNIIPHMP